MRILPPNCDERSEEAMPSGNSSNPSLSANNMKITICGSIAFFEEMLKIKEELERLGHKVKLPPSGVIDDKGNNLPAKDYYVLRKKEVNNLESWVWQRKGEVMKSYFNDVVWADAILVLNYDKNDVACYIGANTFLEMGLAFHLNKKIFLFNSIPEMACKEEILAIRPIIINQNLSLIK